MNRTRSLAVCALFVALIAVGAFVKIPTPLVPLTLQCFFVTLSGLALGAKRALISNAAYLLLGLVGLPIFTKGGGFWYVTEPTFGYLLGFVAGAGVCGFLSHRRGKHGFVRSVFAMLAGLAVIYAVGFVYCWIAQRYIHGVAVEFYPLFVSAVLLCVPGDVATGIVAVLLSLRLAPILDAKTAPRSGEREFRRENAPESGADGAQTEIESNSECPGSAELGQSGTGPER